MIHSLKHNLKITITIKMKISKQYRTGTLKNLYCKQYRIKILYIFSGSIPLGTTILHHILWCFFYYWIIYWFYKYKNLTPKIMLSNARALNFRIKYIYIFKINFIIVFGVNWACNTTTYFMTNPRLNYKLRDVHFLTSCYKSTTQIFCFYMKS